MLQSPPTRTGILAKVLVRYCDSITQPTIAVNSQFSILNYLSSHSRILLQAFFPEPTIENKEDSSPDEHDAKIMNEIYF
jgi:hypothetical protein